MMTESTTPNTDRARAQLARAEREDATLAQLPRELEGRRLPWSICAHRDKVSATLAAKTYGSAPYAPTLADVAALAAALPPLPLALYRARGGGRATTIRPAELTPPKGYEPEDGMAILPLYYQAEADRDERRHRYIFRWYTRLGAELVMVSVRLERADDDAALGGWIIRRTGKTRRSAIRGGDYCPRVTGINAAEADESGHRAGLATLERFGWYTPHGAPPMACAYFAPLGERGRQATAADVIRELTAAERGEE